MQKNRNRTKQKLTIYGDDNKKSKDHNSSLGVTEEQQKKVCTLENNLY